MIIFNTVAFILVIRVILLKQKRPQKEVAFAMVKRIVVIFCLMSMFGLFWLLGAASVYQAAVFFEWPFIILNVAQGIIFFVYIVIIDARKEWRNMLTAKERKKPHLSNAVKQSKVTSKSNTTKETSLVYANATEFTPQMRNMLSEESFEKGGDIAIAFESDSGTEDRTATSIPLAEIEGSNGIDMK